MKKQVLTWVILALSAIASQAQTISDFENFRIPQQNFLNGKRVTSIGYVMSGGVKFNNGFESWGWSEGFAVSNQRNDSTPGYGNMYSAITAKGFNSQNYAVAQNGARVVIPASKNVQGVYVTNSTYAYLSMKDSDQFAKKFGGLSGNDADSFVLVAKGYSNGTLMTAESRFLLADFRFADHSEDYLVKDWTWFSLAELREADSISFSLESSDNGAWGMNTPAFFCIDQFTLTDTTLAQTVSAATFEEIQLQLDDYWSGPIKPLIKGYASGNAFFNTNYNTTYDFWSSGFAISNVVDSVTPGFGNMNAAIAGKGYDASANYAVATGSPKVVLTGAAAGKSVAGFYITNNTYAYMSMKNGDQFAKKFGGVSGNDPDFFEVIVKGHQGGKIKDSVVVALADFRSATASEDYILKTWKWVDLLPLGNIDSLSFAFRSSDNGQFGMNTPGYFCMDNFTTLDCIKPQTPVIDGDDMAFEDDKKLYSVAKNSGSTYTWAVVNGTGSSDSSVVEVEFPAQGTTTIKVVEHNSGCSSDTAVKTVTVQPNVGISKVNNTLQAVVYPNPASDVVNVQLQPGMQGAAVRVYDITGKIVLEVIDTMHVNVSGLSKGVYMLRIESAGKSAVKRLVIE